MSASPFSSYEEAKALARKLRDQYGLTTPRVLRTDLRKIYRDQGIKIDLWPHKLKTLRGAYFDDDLGPTVLLAKNLPVEPFIFTMGHELKHHLTDRELVEFATQATALHHCTAVNRNKLIEIAAEIFAAELIFPDEAVRTHLLQMGVTPGRCTPNDVIRMKRTTSTTLSYAGLVKKVTHLRFARSESFTAIKWKKLEEALYGEPDYKRILRFKRLKLARLGAQRSNELH